ncbi:TonB-dependent siderophore receptor [Methylophaga nitratireducenticrescens]|uniref:Ferrichrome-iron receptor n=1 Tax=Methylophaga nitratireducenticrescens TaxID=754476 RepID=I1XJJ4_METNJ|nr:TonB-dependent receptor [Methylophaga nitratireducenticrescens]AFI84563.1 TonB-dependent siderophore receptor [Methylophaga nitratireducenticrescens]
MRIKLSPLAISISLALLASHAVSAAETETDSAELESITVTASADASAEGLSPKFAGGQVAEGGRAGILGTKDNLDTPFSITSYTNEFIQDRQARSVGEVLQNDPTVRVARGFGNFQESYFIRGFILNSDDIAYNGLYSLLPRQYIATELFERVEVLRGASSFLTGANPNGGGIGGAINLLPKRAPNYDLNRVTVGFDSGSQANVSADVARRFGENDEFGVRVNAAHRNGGTSVDDEESELNLFNVGLDWQGDRLRLSADMGYQNHQLDETRTNVTVSGLSDIPSAPDASDNWAQPWSYSNEKNYFGTFRAEYDLNDNVTAWAAYGMRRSDEANSLANIEITDAESGDGLMGRFDNTREDRVDTGEFGFSGNFNTGSIGHDWVVAYSYFQLEKKNAYIGEFGDGEFATNLYNPQYIDQPAFLFGNGTFSGNELDSPSLNARTKFNSFAIGDTLSFFNDQILLTLGARHQSIKVEDYAYNTSERTFYEESEITPSVGIVFKLTNQVSLYSNYIESLRQGESVDTGLGYLESLEPYVAEQYEVGLKYQTDTLGLGLAYFTTDKPRAINNNGVVEQSGEDQHQGVELTMYGMATDDVKLLGGVTWLDAEQKDTGDETFDGNRVIGVAEWQATIGAEWEIPTVAGLAVDSRVNYTGSRYADAANTLKVDDWTTVDIGARYLLQLGNQDLTLRARVNNLFDRDYWASVGGYEGQGYLVLGAPRTVTLSATMDF